MPTNVKAAPYVVKTGLVNQADFPLVPAGQYTISVAAMSVYGADVSIPYTAVNVPSSPKIVTLVGDPTASLTWSAPQSLGGSALVGYDVLVAPAAGGSPRAIVYGTMSTSATLTGLAPGAWSVAVRTRTTFGEGPTSYPAPVTVT